MWLAPFAVKYENHHRRDYVELGPKALALDQAIAQFLWLPSPSTELSSLFTFLTLQDFQR